MILKDRKEIEQIGEILRENPSIVVTTHINPDGDAIGSMLALYHFFRKQGFHVTAISPNDYPDFLQWLPGNEDVVDFFKNKNKAKRMISEAGLIFHVDYNDIKRCGDMKDPLLESKATKVMIDHHPFPQLNARYMFSYTEVSSTAELIFEFIAALGRESLIDADIATCIYTAMMTDTGCFSYNSSRPRTFDIVSRLLVHGIPKDDIYRNVYDNYSADRMRLLGFCLNDKMKVFPEYRSAFIYLSSEEQKRFNFMTGDSEGFVNYPLSIKGIVFSAFFMERPDKIKISFRSKGSFPVNEFSEKHFSGGGHQNAAGGESTLPLNDTIQKFVDLLPEYAHLLNHEEQ